MSSSASGDRFVYVTYIRTTADRLWAALTEAEFTKQYWFGTWHETRWEVGSPWVLTSPEGPRDSGEVLAIDKPRRLVLRWRNEFVPAMQAEGYSRCTFDIEPAGETMKLTVTHEIDVPQSAFIKGVSGGWPKILSNLKTLLESGSMLRM